MIKYLLNFKVLNYIIQLIHCIQKTFLKLRLKFILINFNKLHFHLKIFNYYFLMDIHRHYYIYKCYFKLTFYLW